MSPTTRGVSAADAGTFALGDLTVNRLGYGAMRLTGSGVFDRGTPSDRDRVVALLRRARELGVDHVDTAAFYFSSLRSANELVNAALSPYPDDLVVATKVGPGRDPSGEWLPFARPDQLRGQVEENLRQLGRDHLDLVNLRAYGTGPLTDHLGALVELVQAGLVRHLGVSNVSAEQVAEARSVTPVVCVQNRFGLEHRDDLGLVATCGEHGIAFVPFFAIAGDGREAGAGPDASAALHAVADEVGATPAQVRLAWTLHQGPHVLAIPGTGSTRHLEENVAAASLELTPDQLARLVA